MGRLYLDSIPLTLSLALVTACAGSAQAPTSPHEAAPAEQAPDPNAPPRGELRGSLAPVDVKKTVGARRDDVRACYRALLEKDPKASGKVVLRFVVGEDGTVEETEILNDTTLPEETARCIADVVRDLQFPKPLGGKARITYPWEFTTE